ncbi:MAG: YIP1 family protein [Paracoccaceae bacterium]
MISPALINLAILTIKSPALAARQVLAFQPGRNAMWTALMLAVVLNTFLLGLQNLISPPGPGLPAVFTSPILYFVAVAVGQVVFIYSVWLAGTWLSGKGSLDDIMAVLVWLQMLQVGLQAVLVLLALTLPALAVMLNMIALIYGIYILLHFVNEAHRLGSVLRAGGVVFASLFAIAFSLSLVIALAGGTQIGLTNV